MNACASSLSLCDSMIIALRVKACICVRLLVHFLLHGSCLCTHRTFILLFTQNSSSLEANVCPNKVAGSRTTGTDYVGMFCRAILEASAVPLFCVIANVRAVF